jgi:hypothetical protein
MASSSSSPTKKVLILGEMNVGKSFILNRLLGLISPNWFRSGYETQALTSIDKKQFKPRMETFMYAHLSRRVNIFL